MQSQHLTIRPDILIIRSSSKLQAPSAQVTQADKKSLPKPLKRIFTSLFAPEATGMRWCTRLSDGRTRLREPGGAKDLANSRRAGMTCLSLSLSRGMTTTTLCVRVTCAQERKGTCLLSSWRHTRVMCSCAYYTPRDKNRKCEEAEFENSRATLLPVRNFRRVVLWCILYTLFDESCLIHLNNGGSRNGRLP